MHKIGSENFNFENSKQSTRNNSQENIKDLENANQQSSLPVNRWSVERILEWFNRKFPSYNDQYKESFSQNQITGDVLLEFNPECLNQLNIYDANLREQIMLEISILKIRNEYEFIKRFRSQASF